jgi:hypothetical protein
MAFVFEMGLIAGATGQQGIFTPLRHLIPPFIYSEVHVHPFSHLYILEDLSDGLYFIIYVIYVDILIYIDVNDRLTTTLYNKQGDSNFAIVNINSL